MLLVCKECHKKGDIQVVNVIYDFYSNAILDTSAQSTKAKRFEEILLPRKTVCNWCGHSERIHETDYSFFIEEYRKANQ